MSGKQKLQRFAEIKTLPNVVETPLDFIMPEKNSGILKKHPMAGKWKSHFFKNNNPLVLELGCGRGEYSVGLGAKYPNKNILGIDIKGARLWRGAKTAHETPLPNVGFLRTRIDFITAFFEPGEVDEIWITFPDPQPQQNRVRKRLTSALFTQRYREVMMPNGIIHLKTDSTLLYEYTIEQIADNGFKCLVHTADLYGELLENLDADTQEILSIKTHYEGIFSKKGFKIKYIKFKI